MYKIDNYINVIYNVIKSIYERYNMRKLYIISVVFVLAMLCGCGVVINKPKNPSLEEKVGQLFLVRCEHSAMESILAKNPAGIVMFGVDFKDLTQQEIKDKIANYQKISKTPLIVAVDEEGGTVVRVSSNKNIRSEKYKSPREYYLEGGMDLLAENAAEKSQLLVKLDINMNLAPVADVSVNEADFIYDRALGENANITARYVSEVVKAMSENDMASCLKHFPGYGNNVDTHTGIATDNRAYTDFENSDFLPFISGIEAGADAVLVSHNIVGCMDAELPASVSPKVHDILRNTLNFNGLIMTDDMSMGAMKDYGKPYVKAVLAGNDLVMVSEFDSAYNEVLNAVKNGEIPQNIIDIAYERIMNWKKENL